MSNQEPEGVIKGEEKFSNGDLDNDGLDQVSAESGPAYEDMSGDGLDDVSGQESLMNLLNQEKSKAEDYFNRLARMQADFDNFRKRVSKEREDLLQYAGEQVITALLPVVDNLERALAARHTDAEKIFEGVEMISRQVGDILSAEGLTPISAVGQQFNPEIHEAVMSVQSDEHPENTVVEELRKGYTLKGKIIRPSMVKVAT